MRFALAVILFCALFCPVRAADSNEARTARAFETMKGHEAEQRIFLQQMPKGGDLHNHLDGAIYAESFLRWAAEDGLCIKRDPPSFAAPPCDEAKGLLPASAIISDPVLYNAVVNSISMRGFVAGKESGHDHFFSTFARFVGPFPEKRQGDMIAEAVSRLAQQNTFYIELMITPSYLLKGGDLGARLVWNDDFTQMQAQLDNEALQDLVAQTRQFLDRAEARAGEAMGCGGGTDNEHSPCVVRVRYLAQIIRTFPREHVFGQIAFAAALAKADPRVAGLNLVAPEDDPATLRDYKDQMRMVGFFTNHGRDVNVTLHAGELSLGLVPPEALKDHIRLAVEAGARRIGHGVDIAYEEGVEDLLKKMAREKIPVEVNLTSNDLILGVKGDAHPFALYRKYDVPLVLSTDDEGVSRIDLTHEYQRAATTYTLGYKDLKALARNSLEYSFLKGRSLWNDDNFAAPCARDKPGAATSKTCDDFLKENEKAFVQWGLEEDFRQFEAKDWSGR